MHVWDQLWPNLVANILWVVPAFLVHRAIKAIRALTEWFEMIKHMEASLRSNQDMLEQNTTATNGVRQELHEWRAEVASRLLDLTDRVATLEIRR